MLQCLPNSLLWCGGLKPYSTHIPDFNSGSATFSCTLWIYLACCVATQPSLKPLNEAKLQLS